MSRPTQWRLYRTSAMRQGRRRRTTSLSLKTRERVLENEESEKKSVRFQKRKSPQIKRPANVTLEKAKSKEARIKVKKEKMDEVITVKQERVEETETLPKGWKSQGEEKRFASMVAAVEWMIQNKATPRTRSIRCGWGWGQRAGGLPPQPPLCCWGLEDQVCG